MRTLLLTLLACGAPERPAVEPTVSSPTPTTRRSDSVDTYHGVAVPDPYDWLEDPDAPEVREWIAAQNVATRAWIDAEPSRPALAKRLGELWQTPRQGVPEREAGRVFFEFNDGTMNQPVLRMAETVGGPAVTVLDPNTFSADGTASLSGWAPSPDGRWLQYGVSEGGSDWTRFEVLALPGGAKTPDVLTSIKFSGAAWLPDGSGFYYARYPAAEGTAANRDQSVWFHAMGTAQSEDRQVYATPDHPDWGFDLEVTDDGRWLVMTLAAGTEERTGVRLIDLAAPGQPVITLLDAFDADYRFVGARGDRLYFRTTHAAPRYRLIAVDARDGAPERWVQVVPEGPDVIEQAALVGDAVVVATLKDARSALSVWSLDGVPRGEVALPGLGSVDDLRAQPTGAETWFAYTGFTQPTSVFRLDVEARTVSPVWEPKIRFDPAEFRTEQVFVERPDGVRVPMFLTWKGAERPKDAPTVLYGYGGFNISITPGYNPRTIAWLEQGGVWATANLRGGGEYGEPWHEAGTKLHKQNVFDDAIACAEWLVANGVSSPGRLAIHGRSNGGLLAGAVVLQRPDLFGAALPTVGVHDMLEYHTWTIGWAWASDYGTVEDPEEFKALLAYSPVHNARPAKYPAVMVSTADHDDRVVPAHTFKFGAALQHAQQGDAPILVRVETAAGHGAGKSQQMRIDEAADELAFLTRALD